MGAEGGWPEIHYSPCITMDEESYVLQWQHKQCHRLNIDMFYLPALSVTRWPLFNPETQSQESVKLPTTAPAPRPLLQQIERQRLIHIWTHVINAMWWDRPTVGLHGTRTNASPFIYYLMLLCMHISCIIVLHYNRIFCKYKMLWLLPWNTDISAKNPFGFWMFCSLFVSLLL